MLVESGRERESLEKRQTGIITKCSGFALLALLMLALFVWGSGEKDTPASGRIVYRIVSRKRLSGSLFFLFSFLFALASRDPSARHFVYASLIYFTIKNTSSFVRSLVRTLGACVSVADLFFLRFDRVASFEAKYYTKLCVQWKRSDTLDTTRCMPKCFAFFFKSVLDSFAILSITRDCTFLTSQIKL